MSFLGLISAFSCFFFFNSLLCSAFHYILTFLSRGQGTSASSKPVTKISDSIKPASTPSKSSIVPSNNCEDDFDPRGTSSSSKYCEK